MTDWRFMIRTDAGEVTVAILPSGFVGGRLHDVQLQHNGIPMVAVHLDHTDPPGMVRAKLTIEPGVDNLGPVAPANSGCGHVGHPLTAHHCQTGGVPMAPEYYQQP